MHFRSDGVFYKLSSDTGAVVLERNAVQVQADHLKTALGTDYSVDVTVASPMYSIQTSSLSATQRPGMLRNVTLGTTLWDARFGHYTSTINSLAFDNIPTLNGTWLYEGLKSFGGDSIVDPIHWMSRIIIRAVDADNTIHFTLDGVLYRIYMENSSYLCERELPPVYFAQLQTAMSGMTVTSTYIDGSSPPMFHITVTEPVTTAGALHQLNFDVSAETHIDLDSILTSYNGISQDPVGEFFFWWLRQNRPEASDVDILTVMAHATVTSVDPDCTIHFIANGTADVSVRKAAPIGLVQTYLNDDGKLDRTEMLLIYDAIESDGLVSQSEFSLLQSIQNDSGVYLQPDDVHNLANAVALGSLGNATYQGKTFGNLTAGSSAGQLKKLVNKWFRGMDNPLSPYSYQLAAGRLFVDEWGDTNSVSYTDIAQGQLGDCYFMAALAEAAFRTPGVITDMFLDNGDGTYTVKFYKDGVPDYVTVDSQLPVDSDGSLVYANVGASASDPYAELWTALAEKAYVEINAKWKTRANNSNDNNYAAIAGGGAGISIRDITGLSYAYKLNWPPYTAFDFGVTVSRWLGGALMAFGSSSSATEVYANHAYAVLDYTAGIFKLFNPWGIGYGLLELDWETILNNFTEVDYTVATAINNIAAESAGGDPFHHELLSYESVLGDFPLQKFIETMNNGYQMSL